MPGGTGAGRCRQGAAGTGRYTGRSRERLWSLRCRCGHGQLEVHRRNLCHRGRDGNMPATCREYSLWRVACTGCVQTVPSSAVARAVRRATRNGAECYIRGRAQASGKFTGGLAVQCFRCRDKRTTKMSFYLVSPNVHEALLGPEVTLMRLRRPDIVCYWPTHRKFFSTRSTCGP